MKESAISLAKGVLSVLFVSLILAATAIFTCNVLFDFHLVFRTIFWSIFYCGMSLVVLAEIFFLPWYRNYLDERMKEKSPRGAVEAACKRTKTLLPKWFFEKLCEYDLLK